MDYENRLDFTTRKQIQSLKVDAQKILESTHLRNLVALHTVVYRSPADSIEDRNSGFFKSIHANRDLCTALLENLFLGNIFPGALLRSGSIGMEHPITGAIVRTHPLG